MMHGIYLQNKDGFPIEIDCTQGSNGYMWEFDVMDYELESGTKVRYYSKKPSGKIIYKDCVVSGNKITVPVSTQMTAESGKIPAQLQIIKNGKELRSFLFYLYVQESIISDKALESKDEITMLDNLINEAERIIGSVRPAYIVVSVENDQEIVKLNNPIRFLNTILTNQEFELSENGVYIAGGVKHVRVSGSIQGKAMQATGYIGIFVNGKITAHKYAYTSVAGIGHCVIPEVILSVKDGDSITICPTDAFPLNGINRAEMTVEKID